MRPLRDEPLIAELRLASAARYGGGICVEVEGAPVGRVVCVEGKVAWATCRSQPEDLGGYLWRLGHLTRTQLDLVQSAFRAHQGRKSLGTLLEELGFMSRGVLRRCLLLHIRSAIEALGSCAASEIAREPYSLSASFDLLFDVEEVCPSEGGDPRADALARWLTEHCALLSPLGGLPGYAASALLSADGEVMAAHASRDAGDPAAMASRLCSALESAAHMSSTAGLGRVRRAVFGCEHGYALVAWLDDLRSHALALVVDAPAPDAAAVAAVERLLPALRSFAGERALASYFKRMLSEAQGPEEQARALKVAMQTRLRDVRRAGAGDDSVRRLEEAIDLLQNGKLEQALALF